MGLFTPAWKSRNEKRALKAVEKMTDQQKLAKVAKEARNWRARLEAVYELTDQTVLADIAKNDKDSYMRKAAVKTLTDQTVLADVAKNDKDRDVREAAVEKLTIVRKAAVEKLTDPAALADIAKNDKELTDVRKAAVCELTDQTALADIAKNANNYDVRKKAIEKLIGPVWKLTDQALLADVAKNDKVWCREAFEKLTDQAMLADVAKNSNNHYTQEAAILKLINQNHLKEALEGIYCFDYVEEEKIKLARKLVDLVKEFDQPLKIQWKAIKDWIRQIPYIPHWDKNSPTCHDDFSEESAPEFPPYPFES
jgi:hypothetical protein